MAIFGILTLAGGLALFLYGMSIMGAGLEKISGGKLERILERLTSNPLKAVLLGAGVTAVIQSSSATTVMVVGFVNSGIMKLSQAIGVIMGANIGTTFTSWLLSLTGIEGDSFFIQLLKPSSFSPALAFVGIILFLSGKGRRKGEIGEIFLGFAVLMFGMESMSSAVKPLAGVPEFTNILTMFSNPLLGVLAGALLTAVIQSSSASVGILQALSVTGALTYGTVIPIIMGQNIGTCVTTMLSAVGAGKNAKRTAFVHLYFNLIGTVLFLACYYLLDAVFEFHFAEDTVGAVGIAIVHSVFNIFTTVVLLFAVKLLERLVYLTIPVTKEETEAVKEEVPPLDERLLAVPSFAIEHCHTVAKQMASISRETFLAAMELVEKYSKEGAQHVFMQEELLDSYEDKMRAYLTQLNSQNLAYADSQNVSTLLHCITDLERISDHAVNVAESVREMKKRELTFSKKAQEEMRIFASAVSEIMELSIDAFVLGDETLARSVEPLEEVIDELNKSIKKRHVKRLRKGKCTIELGLILADIAANYERVADHCSNIAIYMIQVQDVHLKEHGYINALREENNGEFEMQVAGFRQKYELP